MNSDYSFCIPILESEWKTTFSDFVSKASILAIVGVGVYNVSATDAFLRSHTRESVLYLARTKGVKPKPWAMGFFRALTWVMSINHFFTGVWFREIPNGEYENPEVQSDDEMRCFFQDFCVSPRLFFCWNSKEACLGSGTTDSYLNECLTSLRGHHWNRWVRFHHGAFWDLGRAVDSNL